MPSSDPHGIGHRVRERGKPSREEAGVLGRSLCMLAGQKNNLRNDRRCVELA